jgi:hypothetical protein
MTKTFFQNRIERAFDALVVATGYRRLSHSAEPLHGAMREVVEAAHQKLAADRESAIRDVLAAWPDVSRAEAEAAVDKAFAHGRPGRLVMREDL